MLLSFGGKNIENIVKMAKKEDEIVLEEKAAVEENKQEEYVSKVEPAAG